jgi:organic radical activating enzyme
MLNKNIIEAGQLGEMVVFYWSIIDYCQWKCTYCCAKGMMDDNLYRQGLSHSAYKFVLHRLKKLDFNFTIEILGGEPTLHPELPYVIDELQKIENCKDISLITNFAKGLDYYLQFDKPNIEIHISYHVEYSKNLLNKIIKLKEQLKHARVLVEVILYPKQKYYQQMLDFIKGMEDNDINFCTNLTNNNEFWDGIVEDGFYETFDKYLTNIGTKIKHVTDTGVEYVTENDILINNISYYGYKCQPLTYKIDVAGNIANQCTNEKIGLTGKTEDYTKFLICPNKNRCACRPMLHYKKYKC